MRLPGVRYIFDEFGQYGNQLLCGKQIDQKLMHQAAFMINKIVSAVVL